MHFPVMFDNSFTQSLPGSSEGTTQPVFHTEVMEGNDDRHVDAAGRHGVNGVEIRERDALFVLEQSAAGMIRGKRSCGKEVLKIVLVVAIEEVEKTVADDFFSGTPGHCQKNVIAGVNEKPRVSHQQSAGTVLVV